MRISLAMAISAASAGLSRPDMKTQFFPSAFSSRTCFSNALLHSLSTPTTSGIGISRALQKRQPFPSLQKSWDPFCLQCDFTVKRPQILKLGKPFTVSCVLGEDAAEQQMQNCKDRFKEHSILFSNLVAKKERPYFVNRKWSSKDIGYVSFLGGMHLLCLLAPFTFSWGAFSCFLLLYAITGLLGITLSYHRNLSHKSFKLPKWLEYTFAYCGAQAMQGDPIEWVSAHRYHHQYCDTALDPHTPLEGFWHSHMGWLLDDKATSDRVGARNNISDMATDPFYKFIQRTYPLHPILLGVALYSIGGFPYIIWGMAVRAVWVYHITWAVNSAAHVWGTQEWNTGDLSRNNWWVALLAFGEGWHNNHHAFEYSARHGLEWWQLDPTWYMICLLQAIGLATKVKLPSKEHKLRLAFDHT